MAALSFVAVISADLLLSAYYTSCDTAKQDTATNHKKHLPEWL
jgi:hypothetical protein